ncbi:MAG: substrate-binding domain-containing protein [Anaerolineales bacterium]
MEKNVTIRDVARAAGVSPGTASRALNNSPLVAEATRQAVLEAARRLNYQPNIMARRLSLGKTLTIAILAPFFTRPAFVARLRGIVQALQDTSYDLLIHNIDNPESRTQVFEQMLRTRRVDGAIIISLPLDAGTRAIISQSETPVVLIDTPSSADLAVSQVSVDDVAGGAQAVRHLLTLGHRRIAFLGDRADPYFEFTSSKHRHVGYCQALREAGLEPETRYYQECEISRTAARQAALQLLRCSPRPTAIFAASDTQAMGVLEAARATGFKVPEDLSVIGYDDLDVAEHIQLSTVHQQLVASGERGARLLLAHLHDPNAPVTRETLTTHVVARRTTAPPGTSA